jgi:acetyltransferase
VRAFQLVTYRKNQEALLEAPRPTASAPPDQQRAQDIVTAALNSGRELLTEVEAKAVLSAFRIPVVETRVATSFDAAVGAAESIGFPVALKILSADITHKSDVGGVVLNLATGSEVRAAAQAMHERVEALRPNAHISGFSVQPMIRRPAHTNSSGAAVDPYSVQ